MSVTVKHFNKASIAKWYWPLHIAIHPETDETKRILQKGYWASKFTILMDSQYTQSFPVFPNLLLFTSGFQEAFNLIPEDEPVDNEIAAILILEPKLQNLLSLPDFELRIEKFQKQTCVHGIFIIQKPDLPEEWYDNFIIELSHNCSIAVALSKTVTAGYFLYDVQLDNVTKLSNYLKLVTADLRSYLLSDIPLTNPWSKTESLSGNSLADFIEQNANRFLYENESGEGEKIAEISQLIYQKRSLEKKYAGQTQQQQHQQQQQQGEHGHEEMAEMAEGEYEEENHPADAGSEESGEQGDGGFRISNKPKMELTDDPDFPRFLQSGIYDSMDQLQQKWLYTNTLYSIRISIGYPNKDRVRGAQNFPAEDIFISFESDSEPIRILFSTNISQGTQADDIILPKVGNSSEITFYFKTPANASAFKAEITAFHKNRPVQKALLTGYIDDAASNSLAHLPEIAMDITDTYRLNLQDLKNRSEFTTSLELSENVHGEMSFRGISENNPVELNFSDALKNLIKDIKKLIEDTVINIDQYPEDLGDRKNVDLLITLALKGNSLYTDHFKKQHIEEGPIKIVSSRSEFIPLDFMYTKPPPLQDAKLCQHAFKALEEGKCQGCPGIEEDPSSVLCPLGFWCFSKVVERSNKRENATGQSDYQVITEPTTGRDTIDILHNTLFASSNKVYTNTPNLKEQVLESLRKNSHAIIEASDWQIWKQTLATKKEVDCLILLVHIEKDKTSGQDTVEIGDGKFQLINYFNEKMVLPTGATKPPLIILLGCESTNTNNFEFDLSNKFLNNGAGIVLSSFTKIRGRQAGPIVMKLVEFLKSKTGQTISLGEVVLKLRQQLLSKGILSGLSLVSYGDADWKIKS